MTTQQLSGENEPFAIRFGMQGGTEKIVLGRSMDEILKDVNPEGPVISSEIVTMDYLDLQTVRRIFPEHAINLAYECVTDPNRQGSYILVNKEE